MGHPYNESNKRRNRGRKQDKNTTKINNKEKTTVDEVGRTKIKKNCRNMECRQGDERKPHKKKK